MNLCEAMQRQAAADAAAAAADNSVVALAEDPATYPGDEAADLIRLAHRDQEDILEWLRGVDSYGQRKAAADVATPGGWAYATLYYTRPHQPGSLICKCVGVPPLLDEIRAGRALLSAERTRLYVVAPGGSQRHCHLSEIRREWRAMEAH